MPIKFALCLALAAVPAYAADEGPQTNPTHVYYCGKNLGSHAAERACFDIPPDAVTRGGTLFLLHASVGDRETIKIGPGDSRGFAAPRSVVVPFSVTEAPLLATFEATYDYFEGTYPGDGGYEPTSFRVRMSDGTTVEVETLEVN